APICIRPAAILFPLTLTLSPGEREQLQPSRIRCNRVGLCPARPMVLPLLGERVGVRGTRTSDLALLRIPEHSGFESHIGTVTPESPNPAHVSPLNTGTSLAI